MNKNKPKNYFQLCQEISNQDYDKHAVGFYIADAIVSNMEQHIGIYMDKSKKDFGNKENNRIFNTLEAKLDGGFQKKISKKDITSLSDRYKSLLKKTTSAVFQVNFMYDVLNFYLSNAEIECTEAFEKLHDQLIGLRTADWKPKGFPDYRLDKSDIVTREYNALVNRSKNKVQKSFHVVFQQ